MTSHLAARRVQSPKNYYLLHILQWDSVRQRCHFACHFEAIKTELGFDQNLSLSKFVLLGFEDSSRSCSTESPSNTDSAWRLHSRWLLWRSFPEQVGFVTWPHCVYFLSVSCVSSTFTLLLCLFLLLLFLSSLHCISQSLGRAWCWWSCCALPQFGLWYALSCSCRRMHRCDCFCSVLLCRLFCLCFLGVMVNVSNFCWYFLYCSCRRMLVLVSMVFFSNVRSGVIDTAFHLDIAITFVEIHTVLLFKSALLGAIFKNRDRDQNEGVNQTTHKSRFFRMKLKIFASCRKTPEIPLQRRN
jgi:hypothetical protein